MTARLPLDPHPELFSSLLRAYQPCSSFGKCREAEWEPAKGLIPRGFLGATGDLSDVEVVMVLAEPGHPHQGEAYSHCVEAADFPRAARDHAYECFKTGKDLLHRNVRWFWGQLWPDQTFDDQLRRVWVTEGRLCSIRDEIGDVRDSTCSSIYLKRQLALLPKATVVAFGGKAQRYLKALGHVHLKAWALSPPGANNPQAKASWNNAIAEIVARRQ